MNLFSVWRPIEAEKGVALILVVMALLVLSLAGFMAINTATMETQIAGNTRSYVQSFYLAEAAAREVARGIENTSSSDLVNNAKIILPDNSEIHALTGISSASTPNDVLQSRLNIVNSAANSVNATEPLFGCYTRVIHAGPAYGSSLTIGGSHTASSKHRFFVFVRNRPNDVVGRGVLIEIGYLKKLVP